MEFFAEDTVLEMPRGADPWGQRYEDRVQVRSGLASRFEGMPDVRHDDGEGTTQGPRLRSLDLPER
jgi:hypothetical protein